MQNAKKTDTGTIVPVKPAVEEELWCVHVHGTYRADHDWWDVDEWVHILATGKTEALRKGKENEKIKKAHKRCDDTPKYKAWVTPLDSLKIVMEIGEGRSDIPVDFFHPDDTKRYRVAACLIPEK